MFAVVTDSTACLTQAEANSWNTELVEMLYSDGQRVFYESFTDCNGRFDNLISRGRWTTSQPSIGAYTTVFMRLLKKYDSVLCLTLSSRLSGAYSSALAAAKECGGDDRVHIFDSLSTAGGLKLQVKRACELSRAQVPMPQAVQTLEQERASVRLAFSVDSMGPLRRSGRIGVVRQAIGTVLNIRPILKLEDGAVFTSKMSKGKQDQIAKLIETVPSVASEIEVSYFGSPESALRLMEGLKARFPRLRIGVSSIGPVLGIHLGLTALGVSCRI